MREVDDQVEALGRQAVDVGAKSLVGLEERPLGGRQAFLKALAVELEETVDVGQEAFHARAGRMQRKRDLRLGMALAQPAERRRAQDDVA